MDLTEYHAKFRPKPGEPRSRFPEEGVCPIVRKRGSFGNDCIRCNNYYIEERPDSVTEMAYIVNAGLGKKNCKDVDIGGLLKTMGILK